MSVRDRARIGKPAHEKETQFGLNEWFCELTGTGGQGDLPGLHLTSGQLQKAEWGERRYQTYPALQTLVEWGWIFTITVAHSSRFGKRAGGNPATNQTNIKFN
jgi:hypothetical protein